MMIQKVIEGLLSSEIPYIVVILVLILLYEMWMRNKESQRFFSFLGDFKNEVLEVVEAQNKNLEKAVRETKELNKSISRSISVIRDTIMRLEGIMIRNGWNKKGG